LGQAAASARPVTALSADQHKLHGANWQSAAYQPDEIHPGGDVTADYGESTDNI